MKQLYVKLVFTNVKHVSNQLIIAPNALIIWSDLIKMDHVIVKIKEITLTLIGVVIAL